MKIKHKETNIERNPSFGEWIREYVRKELYKDWEILNLLDVVIVKTLHSDGKASTTLMSKGEANKQKNQFSTSTTILKDLVTMEFYQEYLESKILKTKNYSESSFLIKVKNVLKRKPKVKIIFKSIINSKISKVTFGIITTVIGGLLLLIIWKIYENELVEFWKNYIHK